MFILHGGSYHPYRTVSTTYVIATNLSAASKKYDTAFIMLLTVTYLINANAQLLTFLFISFFSLYGKKTVKPKWITDCIKHGKLLGSRDYLLYNYNQ